jgi:hypothetical protein
MPLFKIFLDICLFRRGPQDLPASGFLMGLTLLLNLLASIFLASLEVDLPQALLQSLVAPVFLALFVFGLLKFSQRPSRFTQTVTAGIGCDALITALAIPVVVVSLFLPDVRTAAGLLLFALMLWEMAVMGHIVRQAMEIPFMAGFGLALVYTAMSYRIMMAMFPPLI